MGRLCINFFLKTLYYVCIQLYVYDGWISILNTFRFCLQFCQWQRKSQWRECMENKTKKKISDYTTCPLARFIHPLHSLLQLRLQIIIRIKTNEKNKRRIFFIFGLFFFFLSDQSLTNHQPYLVLMLVDHFKMTLYIIIFFFLCLEVYYRKRHI